MKTIWNITWRVLAAVLLTIYIAVALLNYSLVQSYLGASVGSYFSKEWKCTLRIGSLHAMPWDHLIAHDILFIAPDGDTILDAHSLRVRFHRFPYLNGNVKDGGNNIGTLSLDRVYLGNAYYHFESIAPTGPDAKPTTNLQFIIDYFNPEHKVAHSKKTFTVDVGTVVLNHVHYKMDLPDLRKVVFDEGVVIPHMEFYDTKARIKDVHVVNDDVTARIVSLSTEERSGFRVDNISGSVHVSSSEIIARNLDVQTPKSHIMLDAELNYDNWRVMNHYLQTVDHHAVIKRGTTVAMSDIAYWAPVLWGIDAQLQAEGTAHGTIDNLCTDGLHIDLGNASYVDLVGSITGLPKVNNLGLDFEHLAVKLECSDIEQFDLGPVAQAAAPILLWLKRMEYTDLSLRGKFLPHDESTVSLNLLCGLGNLRSDLRMMPGNRTTRIAFDVNSDGLGLQFLGSDWLSHSALALSGEVALPSSEKITSANGLLAVAQSVVDLQLFNSVVHGNRIAPLDLHAEIQEGALALNAGCSDSLLSFSLVADADLLAPQRRYNADLNILNLVPHAFGLTQSDPRLFSTHLLASFRGNTPDSISGGLRADNTHLALINDGAVFIRDLNLEVKSSGPEKRLQLDSDPLSLSLSGHFLYSDLPLMLHHIASQILPSDLSLLSPLDSLQQQSISDNTLNFTAHLNSLNTTNYQLPVSFSPGTRLSGSYNHRELLKLVLRSDSVSIGTVSLGNVGLSSRSAGANYIVDLESQELGVGKVNLLSRLGVTISSNTDHAILQLLWGDSLATSRGDIMLRLAHGAVNVLRPQFFIGDTPWALAVDSLLLQRLPDKGPFSVIGSGISLSSGSQHISADIALCHQDNDHLLLDFNQFNLGGLCDVLLQNTNISVSGLVGGHFGLHGLSRKPCFNADLSIDSCIVNRQPLGLLSLHSNWNASLNTVNLALASNNLSANGHLKFPPNNQSAKPKNSSTDPTLNFTASFDSFQLALVAPLLSSFSSRFEGSLHGDFLLSGTLSRPIVLGDALVRDGALKIDPTGVTYFFDDSISFSNNTVTLRNFAIRDPRNNLAFLNGIIRYHNLESIALDLNLATDNLLLLDRKNGDDFYGTLLASAFGTVSGSIALSPGNPATPHNPLLINVTARTLPGSSVTVPVSDLKQVKSQNYITFISDQPSPSVKQSSGRQHANSTPFNIQLDLSLTPDLQLNLPMDFSEISALVNAKGTGDLHLSLDHQLSPTLVGGYEIIGGSLRLSMLSLIEKNFTIEPRSSISFQGPLSDARFDLRAVYSQRVNLSTLTGSLSAVDNTQKYIQVDDIIAVAGTLQQPSVNFDLRLPTADQSVQEEVFSYIDRSSERDLINQTVSLLLLGQFHNPSEQSAANTASSAAYSSFGSIASSLGSFVAEMVQFVDINVDYKAANEVTSEQLDLNISKDWGRWYLESTLGYGGESRELEGSSYNGTVLDALIGYRLSPLVHLFAYNRTNTNDYTRLDLPYKQGVGLKLTKDFDRFSDLFTPKKKSKKKKQ